MANAEIVKKETGGELARMDFSDDPLTEMSAAQEDVALLMEIAYLALKDHPQVAKEVRLSANMSRTQHMMTLGLMKSFVVTSSTILKTMIPLIKAAVKMKKSAILKPMFLKVLKFSEEMRDEAMKTRQSYFELQAKIQKDTADVNIANSETAKKQQLLEEQKKEMEEKKQQAEKHFREMQRERKEKDEEVKKLKEQRDEMLKTSVKGSKNEVYKEFMKGIMSPEALNNVALDPTGSKTAIKGVFGIIGLVVSTIKDAIDGKQALESSEKANEYLKQASSQKQEIEKKMEAAEKEEFEARHGLSKLELEKASLGDLESLMEASEQLAKIDGHLLNIICFWDNLAAFIKSINQKGEVGECFLDAIEDEECAAMFNKELVDVEKGWNHFGNICGKYVGRATVSVPRVYGFLSEPIDKLSLEERKDNIETERSDICATADSVVLSSSCSPAHTSQTYTISGNAEWQELFAKNILPDGEVFKSLCKAQGRKSNVVKRVCDSVSLKMRESSKNIVDVWPAYSYSKHSELTQDDIIFVVITKDGLSHCQSFNYEIYLRAENECNNIENSIVNKKEMEEANDVDLDPLMDVVSRHGKDLRKAHSNITMILASALKSRNFGKKNASLEKKPCIVLYTQIKGLIPLSEEPFPSDFKGFPIDVREDCFMLCSGGPEAFHERLKMSCEIGSQIRVNDHQYDSGTLSGFIDHPLHGVCCLTCAHVMFPNFVEMILVNKTELRWDEDGRRIDVFQPSLRTDMFGIRFGKIITAIYNSSFGKESVGVDVALIKMEEREPVDGSFPAPSLTQDLFTDEDPMVYKTGSILTPDRLRRSTVVFMFGATSNIKRGLVKLRRGAVAQVPLKIQTTAFYLENQIFIETPDFCQQGDSGSLVFVDDNGQLKAIGMLEGKNTSGQGFVMPISQVLQALQLPHDRLKRFQ